MLEPIEASDLDLESKFLKGGLVKKKEQVNPIELVNKVEIAPKPEQEENKIEKDSAYGKILAKVKGPTAIMHNDVSTDAKNINNEIEYENKIGSLVHLAEAKGIAHAVKVAEHLEDNYILDELHDRLLAQDLHDALVRKGMITEV